MSILIDQDSDAVALRRGTRRFLAVAFIATIGIVAAILMRQGIFDQTNQLRFVAESAEGLTKGMAVKIFGFRIGAVESVILQTDGKVDVVMKVDADKMHFVTADATVELRKEGLVGSSILEILPGPDKNRLAPDQARLKFARDEGVAGVAYQLKGEVMPILKDIKSITGALADQDKGIPATLGQVRGTVGALGTVLDTSNKQIGNVSTAATKVLGKAGDNLDQLGKTLETTNAKLPQMLEKTDRIAGHVEKITAEAETSVPPVLRDGSAVTSDVREIVSGAKQAWPIRNLVEQPAPAKLKIDSDLSVAKPSPATPSTSAPASPANPANSATPTQETDRATK